MKFAVLKAEHGTKLNAIHNHLTYEVYPEKKTSNILDAISNYEEIKKNKEKIFSTEGNKIDKTKTTFPFWPLKVHQKLAQRLLKALGGNLRCPFNISHGTCRRSTGTATRFVT